MLGILRPTQPYHAAGSPKILSLWQAAGRRLVMITTDPLLDPCPLPLYLALSPGLPFLAMLDPRPSPPCPACSFLRLRLPHHPACHRIYPSLGSLAMPTARALLPPTTTSPGLLAIRSLPHPPGASVGTILLTVMHTAPLWRTSLYLESGLSYLSNLNWLPGELAGCKA